MAFLMHASDAIQEWGFYENALFTCIEADEFLRELYLYMLLHKRTLWHAVPIYAANYDSRANELLAVVHIRDDIYPKWMMNTVHENNRDGRFDSIQKLIRVSLMFKGSDSIQYKGSLVHFTDFYACTSYYYISIDNMITRCACWKECIEKIDSIAENIDSIMGVIRRQNRCIAIIKYLVVNG